MRIFRLQTLPPAQNTSVINDDTTGMEKKDLFEQIKNGNAPAHLKQQDVDRMAEEYDWPSCPRVDQPSSNDY